MQSDVIGDVIARALAEDVGTGDVTTEAAVPADLEVTADVVVKAAGVICGLAELITCIRLLDPDAEMQLFAADGDLVAAPPDTVARIRGRAQAVLSAERTGLNLVQRMSGIATATRGLRRGGARHPGRDPGHAKDAPGLRVLDKNAVASAAAATTGWVSTTESSSRTTTCDCRRDLPAIAAAARPARISPSRWRSTTSTSSRRRSPPAPTRSCSTTWRPSCSPGRRPRRGSRPARGLGRHHARDRPRRRRNGRRRDLDRGPHALRAALDVSLEVHPWPS